MLIAIVFTFMIGRRLLLGPSYDPLTIQTCQASYRKALTAADTVRVDLLAPIDNRLQASQPMSCRELRMLGRLNR